MSHPLTDPIIEDISISYLKNCEGVKSNMRRAADWQLEEDVEFFQNFLITALGIPLGTAALMAQDFKAVMRPQSGP